MDKKQGDNTEDPLATPPLRKDGHPLGNPQGNPPIEREPVSDPDASPDPTEPSPTNKTE